MNNELEIIGVSGIFAPTVNNNGVLLDPKYGGKTRPTDPYVPKELVQRFNVKKGQFIVAKAHQAVGHPNPKVRFIETIDGFSCAERSHRADFARAGARACPCNADTWILSSVRRPWVRQRRSGHKNPRGAT